MLNNEKVSVVSVGAAVNALERVATRPAEYAVICLTCPTAAPDVISIHQYLYKSTVVPNDAGKTISVVLLPVATVSVNAGVSDTTSPEEVLLSSWNLPIKNPASRVPIGPVLIWKVLSETVTVVDSTLVVVPLTKRLPVIVAFPPTLRSLAIPAPPSRTNAPSEVLVLCLVLVTLIIPDQLELTAFIVPEIPTPPLTTRAPEVIPVL